IVLSALVHPVVIIKIGLARMSLFSGDLSLQITNLFPRNICMRQNVKERKLLLSTRTTNRQWIITGFHLSQNPLYLAQRLLMMFIRSILAATLLLCMA